MATIYYAHDIRTYGTEAERLALRRIADEYPGFRVINPSTDIEQPRPGRTGGEVMRDCLFAVASADIVIFSAFEDDHVRKGVRSEIQLSRQLKIPTFWLVGGDGRFVPCKRVRLTSHQEYDDGWLPLVYKITEVGHDA